MLINSASVSGMRPWFRRVKRGIEGVSAGAWYQITFTEVDKNRNISSMRNWVYCGPILLVNQSVMVA